MTVVMTYNSGFFLTIILAAAVGNFLFSVPWSNKAVGKYYGDYYYLFIFSRKRIIIIVIKLYIVSSGGERSDCCEQ